MEEIYAERFANLANNPWISFINSESVVFYLIMRMLKPMDIVSLALATFFRLRPSPEEIDLMKWWKQIFWHIEWVEQYGGKITIIGKDLAKLKLCLMKWRYDEALTKLNLIVVVQETLPTEDTRDDRRQELLQSVHKDIPYAATDNERLVHKFEMPIQMCILFLETNIYIDLDWTWLDKLLKEISPIESWHIQRYSGPVLTGLRREDYTDGGRWFETCYVILDLPHISNTITRPELAIADWEEPFADEACIRLAVARNGSVVIPHLALWLDTVQEDPGRRWLWRHGLLRRYYE